MKYNWLMLIILLGACNSSNKVTEAEINEFVQSAKSYQIAYLDGAVNCQKILLTLDNNIHLWESGKIWTYSDLEEFCPHLPKKNVVESYEDRKLLKPGLGYEYVSQLYVTTKGDSVRESSSRIWKKKSNTWKIVRMNNLIKKEVN